MKRFLFLLFAILALVVLPTVIAQDTAEAPQGTFYGTWPYSAPADHHFNGFATGGPTTNLNVLYRPMVEMPPAFLMWADEEYVPMLAESWGFEEDNSAYWIKLREDAMWSNGDPVTSQDVITTYALGRLAGWTQFTYISDVEAVDEHTVRFVFSGEPSLIAERLILKESIVADATYGELAQEALALFETGATREAEEWTALNTRLQEFRPEQLLATGPYTYTMEDVGDAFLTMHWHPNSVFSETVQFGTIHLWRGETEQTTPLILSGELGHSTNVYPAATVEQFQQMGLRFVTLPRYGVALLFNHTQEPWNIKEVRQAMAHAINREQNAFLTNGLGAAATVYMSGVLDDQVEQLISQDAIDQLNRYEYDLERAEELMTEAGFTRNADGKWADADGNLISAEYTFPADFADFSAAAQDAIQQLNDFGFDITARSLPWQEASAAIQAGDFELSVWSWAAGSPFATQHFRNPTLRFNYGTLPEGRRGMDFPLEFEWNGEQVDLNAMINEVSNGLDLEEQKQRAGEVALIINDMLPFIPLNVEYSYEPINENLIAGVPAEGDPLFLNPSSSGDHFMIYGILTGMITPGPDAMGGEGS